MPGENRENQNNFSDATEWYSTLGEKFAEAEKMLSQLNQPQRAALDQFTQKDNRLTQALIEDLAHALAIIALKDADISRFMANERTAHDIDSHVRRVAELAKILENNELHDISEQAREALDQTKPTAV